MKNYLLPFLGLLLFSCNNDLDDNLSRPSDGENNVPVQKDVFTDAEDILFTDLEGNDHGMGCDVTFCYGYGGAIPDSDRVLKDFPIPIALPESFDLSQFLPPVGDQGQQGSCVSWAISYYMKSMQEKIQHGHDFDGNTVLSPAYTYNQMVNGACGAGSDIALTLDLVKSKGVSSIATFPYTPDSCSALPSETDDLEAARAKISDYRILSGNNMVGEMKALINDQRPIVLAVGLDGTFGAKDHMGLSAYREHTVSPDDILAAHAMLAVGYSDTYQAFKLVNSWGPEWGDSGFVWIDYSAFERVLDPTYGFKVICQAFVAFDEP